MNFAVQMDMDIGSYLRSERISTAPYTTLTKLLEKWGTIQPDREAIVCYSHDGTRTSITYGKFYNDAVKLAKGLIRIGVKEGNYVGIGGNNTPEWMVGTYGVLFAKARPVYFPFHDKTGDGIKRTLTKVGGCKAILFDPGLGDSHWEIVQQIAQVDQNTGCVLQSDIPALKWLIALSPIGSHEGFPTIASIFCDDNTELPEIDPEDIAAVLQTSGSTGFPKVVEKSHYEFVKYGDDYAFLLDVDIKKDSGTIYYNDRPFFWQGGYPGFVMVVGGTRVTQKTTLALSSYSEIVQFTKTIIHKEKPDCGFFVVPFYLEMTGSEDFLWKFRSVIVSGQPIPPICFEGKGKVYDAFSALYGSTEAGMIAGKIYRSSEPRGDEIMGMLPLAGMELKVVGKDGFVVPQGSKGELYIRSSPQFKGYLNDPEKTAIVLDSSGWYKADDFCKINSAGHLEVLGRVSDVMQISGNKITPSFIEAYVKRHPDVMEVVVFAIKDQSHADDVPCAAVVRVDGSTLTEESLREFIKRELNITEDAKFTENVYVPRHIVFLNDLPRTSTGKSDRKAVKNMCLPKT